MKRLHPVMIAAMFSMSTCHHRWGGASLLAQEHGHPGAPESARIAGDWKMTWDNPHGSTPAALHFDQNGSKLTGTCVTEQLGSIPLTGTMDGPKVSFRMELHGGQVTLTFTGKVEGDKMSGSTEPVSGPWTASRTTQPATPKAVLGTVTEFRAAALEISVKPDDGKAVLFKVGPDTQVVRVPPGEHNLDKAKAGRLTDIALGDRVMASFVPGMTEARRIVVITADDIARRNEAERLDWQNRGISGGVAAKNGNEVTLEIRTVQGVKTAVVTISDKTVIRQYAPDSVKFADARMSSLAEIAKGDQFKARGEKSADGTKMTAEEVVFGTFLTKVGKITVVNAEAGKVEIQDLTTEAPLTIRLTADTKLKFWPDGRPVQVVKADDGHDGQHAPEPSAGFDVMQLIQSMPTGRIEELKVGTAVVVTSTRGSKSGEVTAILLLANLDRLIEMAQAQAGQGMSVSQVLGGLHGGVMGGSGGLNLPAMIP